ncbi:MAG: hypothetical protein BRC58_10285 [Cyanobacteria bacterium QS_8_64_29]|nr:MAG: hypothetical protein BRC58_10285 [Cyanobacteria bacterium QS_8_64_29]
MRRAATWDASGAYRYWLERAWDERQPRLHVIMLNPSTANAERDNPTIRRCLQFARDWGYGALEVTNLFAYSSPHPERLHWVRSPVGPNNDAYLAASHRRAAPTVVAWGNRGDLNGRDRQVTALLQAAGPLSCLGLTQRGCPRHSLYLPRQTQPRALAEAP